MRSVRPVADRIAEVVLDAADGGRLPRWSPGAHVDLVLPTGRTRPYSLAGDPADDRSWRLLVARSPGEPGSSAYVHDVLRPGDVVRVRGPRNLFRVGGGARFLFLASGAGIAPLLPMARLVAGARVYPWALVHVDGSVRSTALRDEVEALGPAARSGADRTGVLEALAAAAPGTAVYVCGSARFVDQVVAAAPSGVQVHRQSFDAPGRSSGPGHGYEVELARRGERIRVDAGTALATALHQAGVDVPISCGAGICGACVVGVLGGRVAHRDSILTQGQRDAMGQIVTCVSTAAADRLVLDL